VAPAGSGFSLESSDLVTAAVLVEKCSLAAAAVLRGVRSVRHWLVTALRRVEDRSVILVCRCVWVCSLMNWLLLWKMMGMKIN